jgi:hypothetical protein
MTRITIEYPCRLRPESNRRGHWAKHSPREKKQRAQAALMCRAEAGPPPPANTYVIRLTRIAPRRLDTDNNARAAKATQDGVADWLGIDDGDERLFWDYQQEKGPPKTYAVRIEVVPNGCTTCVGDGVLRQRDRSATCPFCHGKGLAA